jgi:hypothetical protein
VRVGLLLGCSLSQAACAGSDTPVATAADFAPASANGGWTVANQFGEVSFERFEAGEVVIFPLKVARRAGADRYDTGRAAFNYELDLPNPNLGVRERYSWGNVPINNGLGTFHWQHERLAFELKSHRVFVLPRGNSERIDRKQADGTQFWCHRNALTDTTVAIDSSNGNHPDVCPTAFIRTTGETKGPPLLVGLQEEAYIIDTRFVAGLIAELHLDEQVDRVKVSEGMSRQLATVAQAQDEQQRALEAERVRTAGARGQGMIERGEVGAKLCLDVQFQNKPVVVTGFLESVRGEKIQIRVNNVRSADGRSSYDGRLPIDGVEYTPGNVVWANRGNWRACE